MSREYLDFEVEIRDDGTGGYIVAVIKSPAGEARASMSFPFSELELKNNLLALENALLRSGGIYRTIPTKEEETVERFGRTLFSMLMAEDVRALYYVSQHQLEAGNADKGLRVKLRVHPPKLASLPWEFIYDPNSGYVCLSNETPLVRYPEVAKPPVPLSVTPPLHILGMIASPNGLDVLNVQLEKQRMEMALKTLQDDGLVELTWLPGQTWRELQRTLRRGTWHIFHFIGHGGYDESRDEGFLMLADDAGNPSRLFASQIGQLLANHRSLRLALLNSCEGARGGNLDIFSSTAATLIRRGLSAVVAMQYEITERAAIEFGRTFYEALADGFPVDTAVAEARVAISVERDRSLEWGAPVLYMRAPNGEIFAISTETRTPSVQSEYFQQSKDLERVESAAEQDIQPFLSQKIEQTSPNTLTIVDWDAPLVFDSIGIEWIMIPEGEFLMGSDRALDINAYEEELPQHSVYLPTYYISRTPITVAQFEMFTKEGYTNPKYSVKAALYPETHVSWYDANDYCKWLSWKLGEQIRLPTEAEWEKAARGSDGRLFPWGNEGPEEYFCNLNFAVGKTTPVGMYPQGASPYGCLDMAGNVWEWTQSLWGPASIPEFCYPYSPLDGRENTNAPNEIRRVIRGGSYLISKDASTARCASRFGTQPMHRSDNLGFRVVLVPANHEPSLLFQYPVDQFSINSDINLNDRDSRDVEDIW